MCITWANHMVTRIHDSKISTLSMTRKTNQTLKILIYRRTHMPDPCQCGVFGIRDRMGTVRSWEYDAVIGIGGITAKSDMSYKLTWVGINAHKQNSLTVGEDKKCKRRKCKKADIKKQLRAPLFTFDHFCLMNEEGPMLCDCAPLLYRHMFMCEKIPHAGLSTSQENSIQDEIFNLINRYRNCPFSQGRCQCKQY